MGCSSVVVTVSTPSVSVLVLLALSLQQALQKDCEPSCHQALHTVMVWKLPLTIQNFIAYAMLCMIIPLSQDYGEETEGHSVLQEFFKNK